MSQTAVIGHAAESFVIEGGRPLHGRIQAAGNKNGALPILAACVTKQELDEELCSRMRASFLLAGPLLARLGAVTVPPPGGDVIGRRRLDPHIHALRELGAHIEIGRRYEMRGGALRGKHVFLDEASVMATENAVM